jgi:hypothetical protein
VIDDGEIARGEAQIPDLSVRAGHYFTPQVPFHPKVAHLEFVNDAILSFIMLFQDDRRSQFSSGTID